MTRFLFSTICLPLVTSAAFAQVGIGTTNPVGSAALDVTSTTKGFLPPRMTWTQIQAITAPVAGLTVYDIGAKALRIFDGEQWTLIAPRTGAGLADAPGTYSSVRNSMPAGGNFYISAIRIAADGSTIVSGTASGTVTLGGLTQTMPAGAFFAKLNASGVAVFIKPLSCAANIAAQALDVDAAGNIYVGGYFTGTMDADPGAGVQTLTSAGSSDGFLAAYTPAGVHLWSKALGGAETDIVNCVATDGTSLYAGGYFQGTANFGTTLTSAGIHDGWVAKYSAATAAFGFATRMGGPDYDVVTDLAVYSGGGIVVAGAFFSTASFGTTSLTSTGDRDGFVATVNVYGTIGNAHRLGGPGMDFISAMRTDAAGNIYLAGTSSDGANFQLAGAPSPQASAGGDEGFVAKYNPAFNLQYLRTISTSSHDYVRKIVLDTAGNAYVSGTSNAPVVSVESGVSYNAIGGGDAYLMKLAPTGTPLWIQNAGCATDDFVYGLDVSKSGKLLYSTIMAGAAPFYTYDKVRVLDSRCYLARYEE